MKTIAVKTAKYLKKHLIEIIFTDGKKQKIDFKPFLDKFPHPAYNRLQDENEFKKFWIEDGNIVWDNNWNFIFPEYKLYENKIME